MKIMLMPVTGGAAHEVVPPQPGTTTWLYQTLWTADGLTCFTSSGIRRCQLFSLESFGPGWSSPTTLGNKSVLRHLAIHPDGRRIAFGSSPTMQHEVWALENFLPQD